MHQRSVVSQAHVGVAPPGGEPLSLEIIAMSVGVVAGWLAGTVMKGGGYGRVPDALLGVAGGGAASWITAALGVVSEAQRLAPPLAAVVGAAIALVAQRTILPAIRDRRSLRVRL